MPNLFVSHTGDDSKFAVRLADLLERQGHSTWYYERDSLPGISYLVQCQEAIDQSKAFLLLISKASVASHEVAREVELAHRLNRFILPILIDIDFDEAKQRQPSWELMFGTAVTISLQDVEIRTIADRIAKSLEFSDVAEDTPRAASSSEPDSTQSLAHCKGILWASDANQINIHDLRSVVFKNQLIEEFLQRREKCFLSANKGLGKTLLLTFKRSLLTENAKQGRQSDGGVTFVPEGRPYLDFMGDLRTLGDSHQQLLSSLDNAKRVWGLALRMSALSFHPDLIDQGDLDRLKSLPSSFDSWLLGGKVEPTVAFKELVGMTVRNLNRFLDESDNFFERRFRQIHSGMNFFVDKVDQALRSVSRDTWVHVQAGLIEAAWDEMNANSHVKIYASIRQEAFSNYESPLKTNLFGAITKIEYSEDDMRELLDLLARYYENGKTFNELTRLNVVRHPHRVFPEESFNYVRRHTFGRPRDLVIIASEISSKQKELAEPKFRDLVSETAATVLVPNVFEEMSVFLHCLADKDERLRFLSLLPYNVMREEEMIDICYRFNGIDSSAFDVFGNDSEAISHPFTELFRVGLLGIIAEDHDGTAAWQRFRQPNDLLLDTPGALPDASFYFVHPALDRFVLKHRLSGNYRVFQHFLVGHRQPWHDFYETIWNVERVMFRLKDQELRSLSHRALKEVSAELHAGRPEELDRVLRESSAWEKLSRHQSSNERVEEIMMWLEELRAKSAPDAT